MICRHCETDRNSLGMDVANCLLTFLSDVNVVSRCVQTFPINKTIVNKLVNCSFDSRNHVADFLRSAWLHLRQMATCLPQAARMALYDCGNILSNRQKRRQRNSLA